MNVRSARSRAAAHRRTQVFVVMALALVLQLAAASSSHADGSMPPTWLSSYDWPAGDGYSGWLNSVAGTEPGTYSFATGLDGSPGLWIWPKGDVRYDPGFAEWKIDAPGTTRIRSAEFSVSVPDRLLSHHCIEVGLRNGGGIRASRRLCNPEDADPSQDLTIALTDPDVAPLTTEAYVRIAVPCAKNNVDACSKYIPSADPRKDGARIRIANLVLVDDDLPAVNASGELRDLADRYVNGTTTYGLTVDATDAGAGIHRLGLREPSGGEIFARSASCDPRHLTPSLEARVCPPEDSAAGAVDTHAMSEGRHDFEAFAEDFAGNVGVSPTWSLMIDRTPPPAPAQIAVDSFDADAKQLTVSWETGDDPPLPTGQPGSGDAQVEVRFQRPGKPWSDWHQTDDDSLEIDDVADGDVLQLEARSIDNVGNVSDVAGASVTAMAAGSFTDFPIGSADGANVIATVQLRTTDGDLVPVGGLPVQLTDADSNPRAVLTDDDGNAYFTASESASYRLKPIQSGGVAISGDQTFYLHAGEVIHRTFILDPSVSTRRVRSPGTSPSGPKDFFRCIKEIPIKVCISFFGDALRATFAATVLFGYEAKGDVPDSTLANAFKHAYAVARFARTMRTKYPDDPIHWAYDFAHGHEVDDEKSPSVDVRRASFMDTNNNLVGYNLVARYRPNKNVRQLCDSIRAKTRRALLLHFDEPNGDSVALLPKDERQQLAYIVSPSQKAIEAKWFPNYQPCTYALTRYDQVD